MNLKINFGPWETVFKGKLFSHEVEVIMNPEKYFLTIIYDIKDGVRVGALIEGQKAFVAHGHLSSFIQTLPKRCLGIIKTDGNKTNKMLFISFDPIYVNFRQEDFERRIDNAIKKSFDNIETILALGKTSLLELTEIAMAPESESAPIIGDPLMARSLLSGLKKTAMEMIDFTSVKPEKVASEIQLGLSMNKEIIRESTNNLVRSIIIGENEQDKLFAMHILIENFLLENSNVIVFDSNDYFVGLGQSSKNELKLKEELVEFEPAGFPIKKFNTKENIKVKLNNNLFSLFFELMNINDKELEKIVLEYNGLYSTPSDLINQLNEIPNLNDFQKLKLERILQIINKDYKNFFDDKNYLKEVIRKSGSSIGKASIVNTKNLSEPEKLVFLNAFLKDLLKEINESKEKNIIICLPDSEKYFKTKNNISEKVIALQNLGIGFVFGTKKELPQIKQNNTTTIQIVKERDVAISIKNKRNYRILLRPNISGNQKIV